MPPDPPRAPGRGRGPAREETGGAAAPPARARGSEGPRAYLELVRVHLTPTAAADSFAGYSLACASTGQAPSLRAVTALALASILIYWVGMALNDLFDLSRDRVRQPGRPLARGAVRPRSALLLSAALGAGGLLSALGASRGAGEMACLIVVLVLLYDGGGKRVPYLGNLLMGGCRAGNLLLGAAGALPLHRLLEERELLAGAGLLGLYIAGVTSVSLLEDRPLRRGHFLAAASPLLLVPAALAFLGRFRPGPLLNALVLWGVLGRALWGGVRAAASPGSHAAPGQEGGAGARGLHPAEKFVREGLTGIFLVDAGLLVARDLNTAAAAEYGLLILTWLWRRRWLQSPP